MSVLSANLANPSTKMGNYPTKMHIPQYFRRNMPAISASVLYLTIPLIRNRLNLERFGTIPKVIFYIALQTESLNRFLFRTDNINI